MVCFLGLDSAATSDERTRGQRAPACAGGVRELARTGRPRPTRHVSSPVDRMPARCASSDFVSTPLAATLCFNPVGMILNDSSMQNLQCHAWSPISLMAHARQLPESAFRRYVGSPACLLMVSDRTDSEMVPALTPSDRVATTPGEASSTIQIPSEACCSRAGTAQPPPAGCGEIMSELRSALCQLVPIPVDSMDRASIGRDPTNAIVLRHKTISRTHIFLEVLESGDVLVTDAGSRNGTRLNGKRMVEPAVVSASDRLEFGHVRARIVATALLWRLIRDH